MLNIEVRRKSFPGRNGHSGTTVLRDIRLSVPQGQLLSILGPSGCGKTTMLNLIAGLDPELDGKITWSVDEGATPPRIGYVFQNPTLLPWRTVIENLTIVMMPDEVDRETARGLLEAMGLGDYADAYPKELSLGMSRRVALARAFAVNPELLLLDEPFVSLDEDTAARLRALLVGLWHDRKPTVVFVTHDIREAIELAQRVVVLSKGPATVVADMNIDLSNEERADSIWIERWRERLLLCARQADSSPNQNARLEGGDSTVAGSSA
jgi:NitT/TauT family transport system ATP-binding protein